VTLLGQGVYPVTEARGSPSCELAAPKGVAAPLAETKAPNYNIWAETPRPPMEEKSARPTSTL
jgi:hypothetical protein